MSVPLQFPTDFKDDTRPFLDALKKWRFLNPDRAYLDFWDLLYEERAEIHRAAILSKENQ